MHSKHKFYCQHHNSQGVYDELIKVHLKSEFEMVLKYEDTDCDTKFKKFKLVLNKHRVERLIAFLDTAGECDDDYKSEKIVMEDEDTELFISNQYCGGAFHHVIEFEDDTRYECVHLSTDDLDLMRHIIKQLNRKMNY
ncbi:hypothetical protein BPS13_0060 [Bacillus phage BPS13]|uniref:Uncharacterized protein n=2 Tax=Wphvirus BPS13 TaxID=1987727 RepID=A0A173GBG8_9CAUD|nr:hypothetical protein BPS13_0060 [Bacillus phage BPS13]YP_009281968.1 hypothetical protein SALINJAH_14 [Bacillus phage SalinJah]AEZ50239.1 hypothetical protein BPS13_0060 [Bacillus phage BPS13]ANH50662.1 hypothetical protein SALINJAH_14 [Bacillus phage SalinJah]